MSSRSTWIERGSDGRPYFVRKKPRSPSITAQIYSKTLLPKLEATRSLLSFFRDSRQNRHVANAEANSQLALPAPDSSNPPQAQIPQPTAPMAPAGPTSQGQAQPVNMYLLNPQQIPIQSEPYQSSSGNQRLPSQPLSQFIPGPLPPGMFPFPPHPQAPQPPNMFPPPMPFPPQYGPFAMPPPGLSQGPVPIAGQQQASHIQNSNPPIPMPAPMETRYKCEICGRYRSARYHFRHPISLGQPPARTICRKCRQEETDSESEKTSSSDSYRGSRSERQRSLRQDRSRRHRSRSRAHSSIHHRTVDRGYERHDSPSCSESESQSPRRKSHRSERRKYRRLESPDAELVRHTGRLRLSPLEARTYYDRDDGRRVGKHNERRGHAQGRPTRQRSTSRASRPPPSGQTILRRQYSDPFAGITTMENPAAGRHGHVDGPPQAHQRGRYSPQRGPSPPWSRNASVPVQPAPKRRPRDFDGADHERHVTYPVGRHREDNQDMHFSTQRGRSEHRHLSHSDDGEYVPISRYAEYPDQMLQMMAKKSMFQ